MYLPPKDLVTKDYIKQIFKNEKELMTMDQIKPIKVPKYQELSVKALYSEVINDENIKRYLPDIDKKKKPLDREYFFNILNTIYPEYVKQLIEHAQQLRNDPQFNEEKKEYIMISNDWYNRLMQYPFLSKKHGKTVQLLKESTKIYKGRKPRQIKDLGMSLKRFKGMENEQSNYSQSQLPYSSTQNNEVFEYEESEEQSPQKQIRFKI